jgi:hypothetical protein
MSRRSLLLVNSLFRLGYGVGALVAPSAMAAARMAPDTEDRPDARLFVRGFGAHQLAAGAMALGSLRWRRLERPAMMLALAIDALDMGVRGRGGPRPRTSGRRRRRGPRPFGGGCRHRRRGPAAPAWFAVASAKLGP